MWSCSLLLLEDVVVVRDVLASELRSVGFDVAEAGTLAEARALHEAQGPFRVVVADVFLPDGTSPALVRELERGGSRHVLLMTAFIREARAIHELAIPDHWHFVEKPVFPGKLMSELFDLLTPFSLPDRAPVP